MRPIAGDVPQEAESAPPGADQGLGALARHSTRYSAANLLVMVSGFVSFPVFTRLFSVEEYGILGLVSATLALLTGVAKLGVQNSIVRFHGEARHGRSGFDLKQFRSTSLLGMLAASLATTLLWILAVLALPSGYWSDPRIPGVLLLTAVLVVPRTLDSCLSNYLRAEQRSAAFGVYAVAKRYLGLAAVLLTVLFVARSLYGYYAATLATETAAVLLLLAAIGRVRDYSPRNFSPALLRRMLVFGVPMIAYELAGNLLNVGDRYVIEGTLGSGPLGAYSAAYNLCDYIRTILFSSLAQAILPMYVSCWEERGEAATRRFLGEALHYLLLLALPVVGGLWAVGGELLGLLASQKYQQAAVVIPWVVAGMAVDAMVVIVGAGLFIHKRTALVAALVSACAAGNLVLNVLLVPRIGILGAAVATLASYAALAASMQWRSARVLPVPFPWPSAAKFAVLAALMSLAVLRLPAGRGALSLAARVGLGVALYGAMVAASDRPARRAFAAALAWLRTSLPGPPRDRGAGSP